MMRNLVALFLVLSAFSVSSFGAAKPTPKALIRHKDFLGLSESQQLTYVSGVRKILEKIQNGKLLASHSDNIQSLALKLFIEPAFAFAKKSCNEIAPEFRLLYPQYCRAYVRRTKCEMPYVQCDTGANKLSDGGAVCVHFKEKDQKSACESEFKKAQQALTTAGAETTPTIQGDCEIPKEPCNPFWGYAPLGGEGVLCVDVRNGGMKAKCDAERDKNEVAYTKATAKYFADHPEEYERLSTQIAKVCDEKDRVTCRLINDDLLDLNIVIRKGNKLNAQPSSGTR